MALLRHFLGHAAGSGTPVKRPDYVCDPVVQGSQ